MRLPPRASSTLVILAIGWPPCGSGLRAAQRRSRPSGCITAPARRELRGPECFLRNMTFMPTQTRNDRRDLILARAEASRLRRLEEQQIREAQEMVARFFGLERGAPTS